MYQKAAGRGSQGLLLSHQLSPGVSLRREHLQCIFAFPHLHNFNSNVRTGSCSGGLTAGGRCHRWKAGLAPSAVRAKSSSSEKVSKRRPESSHVDEDGDLGARLGTGRRLKMVSRYVASADVPSYLRLPHLDCDFPIRVLSPFSYTKNTAEYLPHFRA